MSVALGLRYVVGARPAGRLHLIGLVLVLGSGIRLGGSG